MRRFSETSVPSEFAKQHPEQISPHRMRNNLALDRVAIQSDYALKTLLGVFNGSRRQDSLGKLQSLILHLVILPLGTHDETMKVIFAQTNVLA